MNLTCVICHQLYKEPVLARDGFCYCRSCILSWVDSVDRWISPLSNEYFEGWPVLREDVERACLVQQARLDELRLLPADEALPLALEETYNGRPAAPPDVCSRLLSELACLTPHEELELAHRAGLLENLSSERIVDVCARDRRCVRVPLLEMSVVLALLREASRRCRSDRDSSPLLEVREHFCWRSGFSDAVEIPASRVSREGFSGTYLRTWEQRDVRYLIFEKAGQPAARLKVPLRSNRDRGVAEDRLHTHVEFCDTEIFGGEHTLFASESEEGLPPADEVWRARRGPLPPFPDSCGGESDDEEALAVETPCAVTMQRSLRHLPCQFAYRPHVAARELGEEALKEKSRADDVLIELLVVQSGKRPRSAADI